jgi:hypothetical protein
MRIISLSNIGLLNFVLPFLLLTYEVNSTEIFHLRFVFKNLSIGGRVIAYLNYNQSYINGKLQYRAKLDSFEGYSMYPSNEFYAYIIPQSYYPNDNNITIETNHVMNNYGLLTISLNRQSSLIQFILNDTMKTGTVFNFTQLSFSTST